MHLFTFSAIYLQKMNVVCGIMMKRFYLYSMVCAMLGCCGGCAASSAVAGSDAPDEYLQWLDELKQDMLKRGISSATIAQVYQNDFYQSDSEVVKKDRKQPEFTMTSADYINRLVSKTKVAQGRDKSRQLKHTLQKVEQKYHVPAAYLVAFWGLETNYGQSFGNYNVIASLTALSYDKRRPVFFRNELYQALKIIDDWQIDYTRMQGSWAGAMGHFQFMPSTFNTYAVDFNHDGQIDIWHSFEDAAASAANYLSSVGWNKDLPWGIEVSLPWNFDFAQAGRQHKQTIEHWQKIGVKTTKLRKLPFKKDIPAAIITPEGRKGKAYLVFSNFDCIMHWNRSENYALAIGHLADYISGSRPWQPLDDNPSLRLKTDDVITIQAFINKLGWFKLDEDGQLGAKTREAVKQVQKKANLPQDGYPDYYLLSKIRRYNPEIGFAVPVPSRKLHKGN